VIDHRTVKPESTGDFGLTAKKINEAGGAIHVRQLDKPQWAVNGNRP
jgi:hypothetical protein